MCAWYRVTHNNYIGEGSCVNILGGEHMNIIVIIIESNDLSIEFIQGVCPYQLCYNVISVYEG